MKIICPNIDCRSENLDQGIDETILCHDCKGEFYIIAKWVVGNLHRENVPKVNN